MDVVQIQMGIEERSNNFAQWYQDVIIGADLAENSSVRGCMVIKPYGYALWERMQRILDDKFKELGHQNAYFPLFIPITLFEKEAEHVEGFAKEMAIVTHHKLKKQGDHLEPDGELETPLAVRPTSELIIGESMSRWTKSYRDLPLLINQWCNVVRWEMRTRLFLRTTEFLWQEGHTAHETEQEAIEEAIKMHEVYNWFIKDVLKMYGIPGKKPDYDRFAGAKDTYTIECMMQDGKALQAATSHYLGDNFAKAVDIRYQNRNGALEYARTTSWGISTRIIGGLIMSHGDDNGINLPSQIAPYHVVIIPMIKGENKQDIISYCEAIKNNLPSEVRCYIDIRDYSAQNKKWEYIRKGVPYILEIGEREIRCDNLCVTQRVTMEKVLISKNEFTHSINDMILNHDKKLKEINDTRCKSHVVELKTFDEMKEYYASGETGFVKAKWAGKLDKLDKLDEQSISIRCIPHNQSGTVGKCILTDAEATNDAIFAKSY